MIYLTPQIWHNQQNEYLWLPVCIFFADIYCLHHNEALLKRNLLSNTSPKTWFIVLIHTYITYQWRILSAAFDTTKMRNIVWHDLLKHSFVYHSSVKTLSQIMSFIVKLHRLHENSSKEWLIFTEWCNIVICHTRHL